MTGSPLEQVIQIANNHGLKVVFPYDFSDSTSHLYIPAKEIRVGKYKDKEMMLEEIIYELAHMVDINENYGGNVFHWDKDRLHHMDQKKIDTKVIADKILHSITH